MTSTTTELSKRKRSKLLTGIVASAGAGALLFTGGGSIAYWSQTEILDPGRIQAGLIDVEITNRLVSGRRRQDRRHLGVPTRAR